MTFLRPFILLLLASVLAVPVSAGEVFLPREPAISPDGEIVVFSFQGDLWSVTADGGRAIRLTVHEGYDSHALFSPDGRSLAYSSNRYGQNDIYLMPVEGGAPRRLTFAASGERPGAFSPDGQTLYFASRRLFEFPMGAQIHEIPVTGGTPRRVVDIFGDEVATQDGETFIIAEGRVKPQRMRYRGSYQREIYSWTRGQDPVRLTDNRGYDMEPMVAPDGTIYWIGDDNATKTANIFAMNADGADRRPVTDFVEDGVRAASLSRDGSRLVIERETALYVVDTAGGEPRRLSIQVAADAIDNPVVIQNKSGEATELAVSSDGEEFAVAISGELFLLNKELGGRAVSVIPGPYRERHASFRPGSADTLLLVTDRDGEDTICLLVSADPEEENLRLARHHKLEPLTEGNTPATRPVWSPQGDRILYTSGNADLRIMNADGSEDRELFAHWGLEGYSWSPDGRWIAVSRYDANFNSDILILPAAGGEAVNITRHPDYDENPVWSADGAMLAWNTNRHSASPNTSEYDVYYVYLQRADDERTREEWEILAKTRDKKPEPKATSEDPEHEDEEFPFGEDEKSGAAPVPEVLIDFEDIHLRARRLTSLPGQEVALAIDPNGDRLYFRARIDGKTDLFSVDRFGEDRQEVTTGDTSPQAVALDAEGKTITLLKKGKPSWVGAEGGELKSLEFSARLVVDRPAVRLQLLDEGWRMLRDRFYDADMHGVDWPALRKKYGAWAQQVAHDVDFAAVVNFMLGELNASHMGYYPRFPAPGNYGTNGYLGLEFAADRTAEGLMVAGVLDYGPCDKVRSTVLPGDLLVSVDGQPVSGETNLFAALENRADLPTWLTVVRDGAEVEFEVVPVNFRTLWGLNYTRMEKRNRARADELSADRVGYVHIQGMGYRNVERFEQNLFAAADGKEALVIDVRNNGGGWTTDLLLTILTQPEHAYTIARNGEIGYPQTERQPFYRWSKPIAVICNQGSYSNAEIFSHAIKTIGRGPVVGMETGGNVISTDGFGNRYQGYIRLPFRGWYVWGDERRPERNHKNQEGVHDLPGFIPDHVVDLTPADRLHGRDPQLEKAVELMVEAADEARRGPQREDHPGGR